MRWFRHTLLHLETIPSFSILLQFLVVFFCVVITWDISNVRLDKLFVQASLRKNLFPSETAGLTRKVMSLDLCRGHFSGGGWWEVPWSTPTSAKLWRHKFTSQASSGSLLGGTSLCSGCETCHVFAGFARRQGSDRRKRSLQGLNHGKRNGRKVFPFRDSQREFGFCLACIHFIKSEGNGMETLSF